MERVKSEVRSITPAIAKEMLKRNSGNRNLTETHSDFLAREMMQGNWVFDGQPIRFSEGGTLLDGQHRLNAVIKADMSQDFLILTGIEKKAFKVMDTGRNRTTSDVFNINGISNSSESAATTRLIMQYEMGFHTVSAKAKMSNTQVLEYYLKHKDIGGFVSTSKSLYNAMDKVIASSLISSFRYLTSKSNVEKSEEFWSKVCHGLAIEKGCPTGILRKKLYADKMSTAKLPTLDKKAIIIKAWNAYMKGDKLQYIRWVQNNEGFPKII